MVMWNYHHQASEADCSCGKMPGLVNTFVKADEGVLDLSISTGKKLQKEASVLDLRVTRDEGHIKSETASTFFIHDGALDLTLKRKTLSCEDLTQKRPSKKTTAGGVSNKHSGSLTVHAIWDLSKTVIHSECPELDEIKKEEEEDNSSTNSDVVDLRCSPGDPTTTQKHSPGDLTTTHKHSPGDLTTAQKDSPGDLTTAPKHSPGDLTTAPKHSPDDSTNQHPAHKDASQSDHKEDEVQAAPAEVCEDSDSDQGELEIDEDAESDFPSDVSRMSDHLVVDDDVGEAALKLLQLKRGRLDRGSNNFPRGEIPRHSSRQVEIKLSKLDNTSKLHSMATKSPETSSSSSSRQRLRPWLEAQINQGNIKGLGWIDKPMGLFRIPWKHGGKHDWVQEDSQIFMEWAKHTGRYREGIDEEDYATWKTRLRCAFNKAPDIVEKKDLSNLNSTEPFRVYQLIAKKDVPRVPHPNLVGLSEEEEEERMPHRNGQPPVPVTVLEHDTDWTGRYPSDLNSVPTLDLVSAPLIKTEVKSEYLPNQTTAPLFQLSYPLSDTTNSSEQFTDIFTTDDDVFEVQLRFQGQSLQDKCLRVTGPGGCCVSSPAPPRQNASPTEELAQQSASSQELLFSDFSSTDPQSTRALQLLPFITPGIMLKARSGNILAMRLCKCAVYYVSQTHNNGEPEKLVRHEEGTLFDFNGEFMPALQLYECGQGPRPSPEVHLMFGQTCGLEDLSDKILLSATITSCKAEEKLEELERDRESEDMETNMMEAEFEISEDEESGSNMALQQLPWTTVSETSSTITEIVIAPNTTVESPPPITLSQSITDALPIHTIDTVSHEQIVTDDP